jgi:hypothetical protein
VKEDVMLATTLVTLALVAGISGPGPGFVAIGQKEGVTVYRRPDSPVIELAAEGLIAAPPARVINLLLDYGHHAGVFANVAQSRVLGRADHALVVYQRLRLPVVSDRDFAVRVRWGDDGQTRWIRFGTLDAPPLPAQHGVVRVTSHDGYWELQPADGGRATRALYRFRIDLAGSIPRSLVAPGAAKALPDLFNALRARTATSQH